MVLVQFIRRMRGRACSRYSFFCKPLRHFLIFSFLGADGENPTRDGLFTMILSRFITLSLIIFTAYSQDIVLLKVGGSCITQKSVKESLDEDSLAWFARSIAHNLQQAYRTDKSSSEKRSAFVIVHGAGSFGHMSAKEYGLKGQTTPPLNDDVTRTNQTQIHGLAVTRLSVQTLNRHVVAALIREGVNAIGISPCFGIPNLQAHGGTESLQSLQSVVHSALQAGLVPVLHGDACLYGNAAAGILSGDTLMEMLGTAPWVTRAVFLTDVDGVYTSDPKLYPEKAQLLTEIQVTASGDLSVMDLDASGSTHEHDVTGGLKTKLQTATAISASGNNVTIARCGSMDAERILGNQAFERGTVISLKR
jgi:isopentenyl phosphate kinase